MVTIFWENRYFGGAGEATEWVFGGGGYKNSLDNWLLLVRV